MRQKFLVLTLGAAVLITGCATKNYVRQNVSPVQAKLDQVADQANKTGADLQKTQQDVAKNTQAISATDEKATGADRKAGDANLDDYKVSNQATVLFKFNSAELSKEDKEQLDQLVSGTNSMKRYFIAVEGHTDQVGNPNYNLELSKRRADSVVVYLSAARNVPFYQIRTIGLGEEKLADPGKTKDARAKNRRVEIKIYSADAALASTGGGR